MERLDQRLASDSPLSEVPTLAEYLPAWLRDLEGDQNTRRTYASHTQSHLILYLGEPMIAVLALIATRRAPGDAAAGSAVPVDEQSRDLP